MTSTFPSSMISVWPCMPLYSSLTIPLQASFAPRAEDAHAMPLTPSGSSPRWLAVLDSAKAIAPHEEEAARLLASASLSKAASVETNGSRSVHSTLTSAALAAVLFHSLTAVCCDLTVGPDCLSDADRVDCSMIPPEPGILSPLLCICLSFLTAMAVLPASPCSKTLIVVSSQPFSCPLLFRERTPTSPPPNGLTLLVPVPQGG